MYSIESDRCIMSALENFTRQWRKRPLAWEQTLRVGGGLRGPILSQRFPQQFPLNCFNV